MGQCEDASRVSSARNSVLHAKGSAFRPLHTHTARARALGALGARKMLYHSLYTISVTTPLPSSPGFPTHRSPSPPSRPPLSLHVPNLSGKVTVHDGMAVFRHEAHQRPRIVTRHGVQRHRDVESLDPRAELVLPVGVGCDDDVLRERAEGYEVLSLLAPADDVDYREFLRRLLGAHADHHAAQLEREE